MGFFKKEKSEPESIDDVLAQFKKLEENFKKVSKELAELKEQNRFAIQKIGMVRFNPFREVGGDQSFSAAFLNDNDTGVVITSYYSRTENRIYGKPVENGSSEYTLSEEESLAIEKAKNSKDYKNQNGKNRNGKKSNGQKR